MSSDRGGATGAAALLLAAALAVCGDGRVRGADGGRAADRGARAARDGGADGGRAADHGARAARDGGADSPGGEPAADRTAVVLILGDGMGPEQVRATGLFAHGVAGRLAFEELPVRGRMTTASLSGITDSAAAATAIGTGALTLNGRVGVDRRGDPAESLVERAHRAGLAAGVVTTAALTDATPAGMTAHRVSRYDGAGVAEDQAVRSRPEVLLGGGGGDYAALVGDGWWPVATVAELDAARRAAERVVGQFAPGALAWPDQRDRAGQPTLAALASAALDVLDRHPNGFFLLVEQEHIDSAGHLNDLSRAVASVLELEQAAAAVLDWSAGRARATVIVTADHETGGLEVVASRGAGKLPEARWRWGQHTGATVDLFGVGPGLEPLDGATFDHRRLHEAIAARIEGRDPATPPAALAPDGYLADLAREATAQSLASGFGPRHNRLDALRLGADRDVLAIGVVGLFEWERNALVVLIDVDFGAGTGPAGPCGSLADRAGRADAILSTAALCAPPVEGFGADLAAVAWGGRDPRLEDRWDDAGLRGLRPPYGDPADLGWLGAATGFADGVRPRGDAGADPVPDAGWEAHLPWATLYPDLAGGVPPGAEVAVAAVLVNDDGTLLSNQALPPFPAGAPVPGPGPVALPGVAVLPVDADRDGTPDADAPPRVLP